MRGLHYDIEKGLLMKMDQFQQLQIGSIYRGLTCLTQEEVMKIYGSRSLPLHYVEGHLRGVSMYAILSIVHTVREIRGCLWCQLLSYVSLSISSHGFLTSSHSLMFKYF